MARGGQSGEPIDWVTRAADDAIRHAGEGNLVTVASGASPSGPIHLGNLREFLTPHFVAEELRRRGLAVRHLHSWDDYDRFRKVPAGVPAEWADHLSRFVGLDNYIDALGSAKFWEAMETTVLFTVISVGLELALGLGMALVMHRAFRGRGLLRTVVLVPWAILTVVTAITWRTMFEPELGFVNTVLSALSLPGGDVVWLGEEGYALAVMILADVWKTSPFMALLLLAGLQGIPDELHDAAKVDGANAWQRFRSITLPLLVPAITVALIFRTLDALRVFDLPYVLTKGANGTETLSLLAQTELVANRNTGLGSALAVLTFITVMGISFLYIRFMGGNIRALTREEE